MCWILHVREVEFSFLSLQTSNCFVGTDQISELNFVLMSMSSKLRSGLVPLTVQFSEPASLCSCVRSPSSISSCFMDDLLGQWFESLFLEHSCSDRASLHPKSVWLQTLCIFLCMFLMTVSLKVWDPTWRKTSTWSPMSPIVELWPYLLMKSPGSRSDYSQPSSKSFSFTLKNHCRPASLKPYRPF